jgi:hypothetical protein
MMAYGLDGDERVMFKHFLINQDVRVWTGLIWLKIGTRVSCCEHGNEPLGTIKCREFLD